MPDTLIDVYTPGSIDRDELPLTDTAPCDEPTADGATSSASGSGTDAAPGRECLTDVGVARSHLSAARHLDGCGRHGGVAAGRERADEFESTTSTPGTVNLALPLTVKAPFAVGSKT